MSKIFVHHFEDYRKALLPDTEAVGVWPLVQCIIRMLSLSKVNNIGRENSEEAQWTDDLRVGPLRLWWVGERLGGCP